MADERLQLQQAEQRFRPGVDAEPPGRDHYGDHGHGNLPNLCTWSRFTTLPVCSLPYLWVKRKLELRWNRPGARGATPGTATSSYRAPDTAYLFRPQVERQMSSLAVPDPARRT